MLPVAPLIGLALLAADANTDTAVLVSRRTGVPRAEARKLADACAKGLAADGVELMPVSTAMKQLARLLVKDTSSCAGRPDCVAELGRQLSVKHVVAVSVSRVNRDTALGLELLRVEDEQVVATDSLILPKRRLPKADQLAGFAEKVKAALAPPAPPPPEEKVEEEKPPPPPDEPKEVKLTPPPKEEVPPPLPPPPPPPARSHVASFALGGAGVAALAAGATMLAIGLSSQASLAQGTAGPDGRMLSPLTGSEAQAKNANANLMTGVGAGAAAVGAGLGATAVFLW